MIIKTHHIHASCYIQNPREIHAGVVVSCWLFKQAELGARDPPKQRQAFVLTLLAARRHTLDVSCRQRREASWRCVNLLCRW
jgi:hypothetical protein